MIELAIAGPSRAAMGHDRRFREICVTSAYGPKAVRLSASRSNQRHLLLAQILADEILHRGERIIRAAGARTALGNFLLCRGLRLFRFRLCRDPDLLFFRRLL